MPRRKNGKRVAPDREAVKPRARSKDRRLVVIDQGPLRRAAATECGRAMKQLRKAQTDWERFEHEDAPAFERWMAATFGALLSRVRENDSLIGEKQHLIREIEVEMLFGGARSHRAAYAKIMRRRADPRVEHGEPEGSRDSDRESGFEEDDAGPVELDEFEKEMLFDEFLRATLGINPDKLGDADYEEMFESFKANVLNSSGSEARSRKETPPPQSGPAPSENTEQARIKEIYRTLVRRLHPDLRADKDAAVSALWHEVQEAYGDGNLPRLEMLLALTDIEANSLGAQTTLFQIRAVLAEFRRAFNALQRSLRSAKKQPAWNFSRKADRTALRTQIERELESDLARQQRALRELDALLSDWSQPPVHRPKRRGRFDPLRQDQFSF